MENFFPDLPARYAAVAAGKKKTKKKKKKRRGRKETTRKCGRVRGGECGSELVVPLLVVVVVVVLCVCFILGVWWSPSLLGVSLLSLVPVFDLEIWCSKGSQLAHDGDEHRVLGLCNVRRIGA
jgi:hypothetical protein